MSPQDPALVAAAWALVHFLWQGALVWVGTALALRLSRSAGAQVRYLIACASLAFCLLLPLGTFLDLRPAAFRQAGEQAVAMPSPPIPAAPRGVRPPPPLAPRALPAKASALVEDHLVVLFRCWLLGSLILALRFGGGWLILRGVTGSATAVCGDLQARFDRIAERVALSRPVRLAQSARIHSPMVIGFLRPILLMPLGLAGSMDPLGLEALLVHELAHIRRHDYLVNVLQCAVEILLFYHPAVWWISRRIRTERELCCDDAAVAWCRDPLLYAETLTRLQALRPAPLSPALAAGGGDLMSRIKRLLVPGARPGSSTSRFKAFALAGPLGLALALCLSLGVLRAATADTAKWFLAGSNSKDYVLAVDPQVTHDGKPSQSIRCAVADGEGFGTVMQKRDPADFLGKRVRMSAWVKTRDLAGWGGLWLRVDGAGHRTLAFDNMGRRPIRGTTDWQRYEVVLDVAKEATGVSFGLLMAGAGQAWVSEPVFEVVDASVAVTDTAGAPPPSLGTWLLAGSHPADYAMGLDPAAPREGKPTRFLAAKTDAAQGFGTLMKMLDGKEYLGKRVRLSAWVKAENVASWAGLWMRVDGPDGKATAFDNMQNRPIKGTQDWTLCQITLDLAKDSKALALGILMEGKGKVWMTEPKLEVVDAKVAVTDMRQPQAK